MLKGGFPPIYPKNITQNNQHIKRNINNNILDINTIFLNKKSSSNLVNLINLTTESENKPINKKKNRNYKSDQTNVNFIDFINDLSNIKKISRINKKKN